MNNSQKAVYLFVLSVLSVFMLCACKRNIKTSENSLEIKLQNDEIFLYNAFSYKLGIYNLKSKEWKAIGEQEDFFQTFENGTNYPYFVIGSSSKREIKVGKYLSSTIKYFYSLDNNKQELFPLAADENKFLYLIEQIDNRKCFKHIVTISDDGEMRQIANIDDYGIVSGILINDELYFTCYCEESDDYEIWCLDLSESIKQPKLIKKGYSTFKIYKYKNQLMYLDIDELRLYNDYYSINLIHKADMLWIDEKNNIIIEEFINNNNDLELLILSISTGEILNSFKDSINFICEDNFIRIYGNGYIKDLSF